MGEQGKGLLMLSLGLFVGGLLFGAIDAGADVPLVGGIGSTFLFLAVILFIIALFTNGDRAPQQQQQQQVVVVRRSGNPGGPPASAKATPGVRCPSCARVNVATGQYCGHCGTHLGTA